jgi:hypothetical protein
MLLHEELFSFPFFLLVCDVTNSQDFLITEELINYVGKNTSILSHPELSRWKGCCYSAGVADPDPEFSSGSGNS